MESKFRVTSGNKGQSLGSKKTDSFFDSHASHLVLFLGEGYYMHVFVWLLHISLFSLAFRESSILYNGSLMI